MILRERIQDSVSCRTCGGRRPPSTTSCHSAGWPRAVQVRPNGPPEPQRRSQTYTYYPGPVALAGEGGPRIHNASSTLAADIQVPEAGVVIVTDGGLEDATLGMANRRSSKLPCDGALHRRGCVIASESKAQLKAPLQWQAGRAWQGRYRDHGGQRQQGRRRPAAENLLIRSQKGCTLVRTSVRTRISATPFRGKSRTSPSQSRAAKAVPAVGRCSDGCGTLTAAQAPTRSINITANAR